MVAQLKLHGFPYPSRLWTYYKVKRERRVSCQHDMDQNTVSKAERPINLQSNITAAIVAIF
jgi:hypothetical protein